MTQKKVAFCTTCKGRLSHLKETLPKNVAGNRSCIHVVLSYNDSEENEKSLLYLVSGSSDLQRVVVYRFNDGGPFRMAHAKNMAHRLGILEDADLLVNMDADNFAGDNFDLYVRERFDTDEDVFLWSKMVKDGPGRLPRGISGRIAVTANAFLKAGGYNERFSCWSPDDKDFNLRLQRLGYDGLEIDPKHLDAILHNDAMRFKEYRHVANNPINEDDFTAVEHSDASVANFGRVGCGTVYRNFSREPVELNPIPTRIFGIGLHKTATNSLHAALEILGFESAHWKSAHWAKAIWTQMREQSRSATLERHYALSDLPIPLLYRELDAAYPGSKFVLTIRPEADWLRSVRNHWDGSRNRFKASWKSDPFSNAVHRELYGQTHFDAEVFLARYRRHNQEVRDHFRNRPDDLLVMEKGWDDLCHFLGKAVPDAAYPVEYVTGRPRVF